MAHTGKDCPRKNLFCREGSWQIFDFYYGGNIFSNEKGARLRECRFGKDCRGAHTPDEIVMLPHVHNFNNLNKKDIDLVEIYNNVIKVFEESKSKVLNTEFIERLAKYQDLNFIELINLWFDVTCYHRKIKKDMRNDSSITTEFSNITKIPEFLLDCEDVIWPLERLTKLCSKNEEMIRKIKSKKEKPNIWDICLASVNCKLGCHNINHMICNTDLLSGECDCVSKEEFETKKENYLEEIKKLTEQLESHNTPSDGFTSVKTKKKNKKYETQKKLNNLNRELDGLRRKVHLTEEGMISFDEQLHNYQQKKLKEIQIAKQTESDRAARISKGVKNKVRKPVF